MKLLRSEEFLPVEQNNKKGKVGPIDVAVGRELKKRRTLLGMSQEELASKVDLTFQQIQKYESGANRISASRLYEFSVVLDCPVEFFFASWKKENSETIEETRYQNPFKSKETMDMVAQYYSLETEELRARFMTLLKTVSKNQK